MEFSQFDICRGAADLGSGDIPGDPPNWPDADRNGKHFVLVHGYNVNDTQSKGWAAELFKRMFWSGSNARFSAFAWYGYQGQINIPTKGLTTPDYQVNLGHAFGTANSFKQFLDFLEGQKTVAAHSMGNILMDLSVTMQGAGGVGGLLAVTYEEVEGDPLYFTTFDGNGNVSEYLTPNGVVMAHYEYDAFGNDITPPSKKGDKHDEFAYRFSTKPYDGISGWYYYGYRYYDPLTGRWPSRDPIGERGGKNLYGFVGNKSLREIDPLGMEAWRTGEFAYPTWHPRPQTWTRVWSDYALYQLAVSEATDLAWVISYPASVNMRHYLAGSGAPRVEPLGRIAENDEPSLKDTLFADLVDAVTFAAGLRSSTTVRSQRFTDFLFETWKWFYAQGTTHWAGGGDFTLDSETGKRQLTVSYHHWDPYDFENTNDFAGPGLTDSDWQRLHLVGLGKEFLITGDTASITLKWCGELNMSFNSSEIDFERGSVITIDD